MTQKTKTEPRGVGRPTEINRPTRKVYVTLDEETIEKLRVIGTGNISAGIRKAVARKRVVQS